MPHIIVEYSSNLEQMLDVQELLTTIHQAALATGIFPVGGARTRGARRDRYVIADGDIENAFIHVIVKIGHGRDEATRSKAAESVFSAMTGYLESFYQAQPIALSLELVEIDPRFSFKQNNLREYLAQRESGE